MLDKNSLVSKTESELLPDSILVDERRLVRKLDLLYVIPYVFIVCFLKYANRTTYSIAAVMGIISDTHVTNNQFGFAGAVFYLGFLIAQAPSALLIQKFSLKKYLGVITILCGATVTLMVFSKESLHLIIFQFLLGLFQASIHPCCVMIISRMYRRSEQPRRLSVLVFGDGIAIFLASLIGYGIGYMENVGDLLTWQWLMVIFGSFTIIIGACCFLFMVDDPKSRLLRLTPNQEQIVEHRILDNAVSVSRKINYDHIKESLREPRYYCYVLASVFINLQNGAIQVFGSIIVSSFGFSNLNTILLGIPAGICVVTSAVLGGWYVGRYGNMHYAICVSFGVSALGVLIMIIPELNKARLVGVYLCTSFSLGLILIFSSIANNVNGYTKKIFYLSSVSAAYTTGCFIGPQLLVDSQKPLYLGGMITYIACDCIAILLLLYARYTMLKSNKKRLHTHIEKIVDEDHLTDKENSKFIYIL